jgi:predicted lactoylglutathione lyase
LKAERLSKVNFLEEQCGMMDMGSIGTTFSQPMEYGFMYGRSFQDMDGHIWEFIWMDPSATRQH